ncbi:MAG: uroporphyrinogen-III synthase [Bacteroidales bacterium]|jgi:uroporphyrinogen-III synthase|nr:uroporphyrinogen-III synthase [Bacteroidales bacterium]
MSKSKIKNVLISQPAPADLEKSQYKVLIDKYGLNFTFNKLFDVVGLTNREYRESKINILDYSAVIVTSKLAVDNYFRLAKELRITIPETMKFFCVTEGIANYLQNYIQYRKRKIFYGKLQFVQMMDLIVKHKDEKYLYPCSEDTSTDNFKLLDASKINYTKSVMYRSAPKTLTDVDITQFDMIVMFSPIGVKSFTQSFPSYDHNNIVFAAFGSNTQATLKEAKIKTMIPAPTTSTPSMIMAIDQYLSLEGQEKIDYEEEREKEFLAKTPSKAALAKAAAKAKALKKRSTPSKKKTATKQVKPSTKLSNTSQKK